MIKLTEKIGYGFGDMASSMFWKLFGAYLMIFYTDVFGLPAAAVGTMFLITRCGGSYANTLGKISPLFALAGDPVRRYRSAHFHDSFFRTNR